MTALAVLQQLLMENPEAGAVMPGCGGLRKLRSSDASRGKGKRGGARVIYLHVPLARRFYMLDIYGKDEKDDPSADEKKQLRQLAEQLKREAIAAHEALAEGERVMATKTRKPIFERLKAGLEEGLAHVRGELTLKTVEVPDAPPEIDAKTLVALREEAAMSQAIFAKVLYVSSKTVQSWEQGHRVPSMASRRLIHLFTEEPGMVCKVVGLPAVQLQGFRIVEFGKGKRRIVRDAPNGRTLGANSG